LLYSNFVENTQVTNGFTSGDFFLQMICSQEPCQIETDVVDNILRTLAFTLETIKGHSPMRGQIC